MPGLVKCPPAAEQKLFILDNVSLRDLNAIIISSSHLNIEGSTVRVSPHLGENPSPVCYLKDWSSECPNTAQYRLPVVHSDKSLAMVCLLWRARACLDPFVGRPILELVPVLLPKPAPEWRGFVENVAERATPCVGKLTGERKSGPRKAICAAGSTQRCISRLLRTHLHHPASLPCNRLHSPGPIFVQFVLSLLSFIYTCRL